MPMLLCSVWSHSSHCYDRSWKRLPSENCASVDDRCTCCTGLNADGHYAKATDPSAQSATGYGRGRDRSSRLSYDSRLRTKHGSLERVSEEEPLQVRNRQLCKCLYVIACPKQATGCHSYLTRLEEFSPADASSSHPKASSPVNGYGLCCGSNAEPCLRFESRLTGLWALLQRTSSQDERLERMAQHRRGSRDFDLLANDEGWDEVMIRRHLLGKLLTRAGEGYWGCCFNWAKQHTLQEAQQGICGQRHWVSVRMCFCSGRLGRSSPNARSSDCDMSGSSLQEGVSVHRR